MISPTAALRLVATGGTSVFQGGSIPPGRSTSLGVNDNVQADAERYANSDDGNVASEHDLGVDDDDDDGDAAIPRAPTYRCPKEQLDFARLCVRTKFGRSKEWIFHPPQHGLVADSNLSAYYLGSVILW
jgi:hypothetical protein